MNTKNQRLEIQYTYLIDARQVVLNMACEKCTPTLVGAIERCKSALN